MTTTTTLWRELSRRIIEIPLIQRDYAQGRKDKNAQDIRRNIVAAIRDALDNRRPLNFDFVYGQEEDSPQAKLVPIDGQQRLTTLFLVHWYLAVRDGKNNEAQQTLQQFTYRTRVSSTDFCEKLTGNGLAFLPRRCDEPLVLSEVIEDQPWFIASWTRDPTVAGMLVMLNEIHRQLKDVSATFQDLIDNEWLTFHITDTKELDLDENTYIRMNSRGRLLTEYEHFKAQFVKFLIENGYQGAPRLATKMDIQWSRVLWQYRDTDDLIDSSFMAVFSYVSEISFHLDAELSEKNKFNDLIVEKGRDYWKEIFKKRSAVERLEKYMDTIVAWRKPSEVFRSISNPPGYYHPDISLLGEEPDLILRSIQGRRFEIAEKIILFMVLEGYCADPPNVDVADLSRRIRVVRNMLVRICQDDRYKFGFRSDLRSSDMSKYLDSAVVALNTEASIYEAIVGGVVFPGFQKPLAHENDKAALIVAGTIDEQLLFRVEDDPRFLGTVWTLIPSISPQDISESFDAFRSLLDLEDQGLVSRALLTQQEDGKHLFYGEDYGRSAIGERWYYGHGDRWRGLLAHPQKQDSDLFPAMRSLLKSTVDGYRAGKKTEEILNEMITAWLTLNRDFDNWRYYFIKYKNILDSTTNLFAWRNVDDNDFEIRTMSSFHARGRHINTYGRTVEKLLDERDIVAREESRSSGNTLCPLVLRDNTQLYCEKDGWRIVDGGKKVAGIADPLVEPIPGKPGQFLLSHTRSEDRIEVALRFAKGLFPDQFRDE